jgi:DNA modification methylase
MNFSNDQEEDVRDRICAETGPESVAGGSTKRPKRLAVVYRAITSLKLNPKNPRIHNRAQRRRIAASITKYGFCVPILIDSLGNVIAGHGRIQACIMLGLTEVPTICLDHLTEAEVRAFMLADNRLTEMGDWDDQLLGQLFLEIQELDPGFDLELTGFDMGEIDLSIEGINRPSNPQDDPADSLSSALSGAPPVTRRGDLWVLQDHRVFCGSALEEPSYVCLMQSEKASSAISDPPYNVEIEGNVSGLGAVCHRNFEMASGEMSKSQFIAFLTRPLSLFAKYSRSGSLHFVFMDWRHIGELHEAGRVAYSELKNIAVWVKNQPGMGSLYRSQHEFVFVFKSGIAPHRNNVQLGRHGRNRSNVWEYPSIQSFGRGGEEGNLLHQHPTVKPVAMLADAIMDCTARGEIVLDGFLGSGSTIIAAQRTGRRCFGIEIDPAYVDTAIRRWQTFTRQRARHAVTGRFFDEVECEEGQKNGN